MLSFPPKDFRSSLYLMSRCLFSLTFSPAILIPVTQLPPLINFLSWQSCSEVTDTLTVVLPTLPAAKQELAPPFSCHGKLNEGKLEMGCSWYWLSESSWEETRPLFHQFTTYRVCKTMQMEEEIIIDWSLISLGWKLGNLKLLKTWNFVFDFHKVSSEFKGQIRQPVQVQVQI